MQLQWCGSGAVAFLLLSQNLNWMPCTRPPEQMQQETCLLRTEACRLEALLPLLGPETGDIKLVLNAPALSSLCNAASLASLQRLFGAMSAPNARPGLTPAPEASVEMSDRYAAVLARLLEQTDTLERENDELRATMTAMKAALDRQTAALELLASENAKMLH